MLKESGTLTPKKRVETWRKIDPEKLRKYIEEHPDSYMREKAREFGCAISAVGKALSRLKITRKKTIVYRERSEEKRHTFISRIKRISAKNLIYVDKAGVEECLFREYARAPIRQIVTGESAEKNLRGRISCKACRSI